MWEGYSWKNTRKGINFRTSPLLTGFLFNTVQGWTPGLTFFYSRKIKETNKELQAECRSYYGLSSSDFYLSGDLRFEYNPKTNSQISISGGREASQFNGANPISPFVNCMYSLLDKRNYMKLYRNEFGSIRWRSEPVNGLTFFTSVLYSVRSPLSNTSDFSWVKRTYDFTSNNPGLIHADSLNFLPDSKAEISLGIRYRPGQRYYLLPNEKINIRSKYPEFSVNYSKALHSVFGSRVGYDLLIFSVADRLNLKRFGRAQFLFRGGKFFNASNLQLMDYKHFSGNQTYFTDFDLQKFQLLDYYTFSTRDYFLEGWYTQNFGGFFLNSIPIVKKLKLEEIVTFRYAYTEKLSHYLEFSAGIRYLLARLDYVWGIRSNTLSNGIRFGFLF
jgi:hypothetical protein